MESEAITLKRHKFEPCFFYLLKPYFSFWLILSFSSNRFSISCGGKKKVQTCIHVNKQHSQIDYVWEEKQGGEWMEGRIQLQSIYTCVGQLPSHNRESAQLANISRVMLTTNLVNVKLAF